MDDFTGYGGGWRVTTPAHNENPAPADGAGIPYRLGRRDAALSYPDAALGAVVTIYDVADWNAGWRPADEAEYHRGYVVQLSEQIGQRVRLEGVRGGNGRDQYRIVAEEAGGPVVVAPEAPAPEPTPDAVLVTALAKAHADIARLTRDATAREGVLARRLDILRAAERERDEARATVGRLDAEIAAERARYRIVCDPLTQVGYPCVRGTRITIDALQGGTVEEAAADYGITVDDVADARMVYRILLDDRDDDDADCRASTEATIATWREAHAEALRALAGVTRGE